MKALQVFVLIICGALLLCCIGVGDSVRTGIALEALVSKVRHQSCFLLDIDQTTTEETAAASCIETSSQGIAIGGSTIQQLFTELESNKATEGLGVIGKQTA